MGGGAAWGEGSLRGGAAWGVEGSLGVGQQVGGAAGGRDSMGEGRWVGWGSMGAGWWWDGCELGSMVVAMSNVTLNV